MFGGVGNGQTVSGSCQQGTTFVFWKGHNERATWRIDQRGVGVNVGEPDRSLGEGSRERWYLLVLISWW